MGNSIWTVTIDSSDPSVVYAASRTQGVFRSLDRGRVWQAINNGLMSLTIGRNAPVTIDSKNPQTLHVGSERDGVFKSLDGGDHWFAVNAGLRDLSVWGLVVAPDNSSVLYACGPSGVYKTVTGGEVRSASIAVNAIANGASNLGGPISPGEIVVITGSGLGPSQLILATPETNGLYSAQLSGTSVQFNGTPEPLIYTSAGQVAAQVPDSVSIGTAQVTLTYDGRTSASFPVQVAQYAPGVFTLDSTGKGQAVAVNQDGSINSASTPARLGDLIVLYATGVGQGDGPVQLTVGAQSASLTVCVRPNPGSKVGASMISW